MHAPAGISYNHAQGKQISSSLGVARAWQLKKKILVTSGEQTLNMQWLIFQTPLPFFRGSRVAGMSPLCKQGFEGQICTRTMSLFLLSSYYCHLQSNLYADHTYVRTHHLFTLFLHPAFVLAPQTPSRPSSIPSLPNWGGSGCSGRKRWAQATLSTRPTTAKSRPKTTFRRPWRLRPTWLEEF